MKKKKKNFLKNTFRSLGLSFKFSKWATFFLIVLTVATMILPVFQSKVMGEIVDSVVGSIGSGGAIAISLVVLYALVWSVTKVFSAIQSYVSKIWFIDNEQGLEILVMKKRTEIDLGHYENPEFQNLLTRAFRRSIWPVLELTEIQIRTLGNIATFLLTSFIATKLSLTIYLVIIITALPSFLVNLKYGAKVWTIWSENTDRQKKYQHARSHILGKTGIIQTKLLQSSDRLLDVARDAFSSFRRDQLKADKKNLFYSSFASIVGALGVGVGFYLIVIKVSGGEQSVGSMVFLMSVLGQLVGSINSILSDVSRSFERNLYVNEIFEVLDIKPFLKLKENPISLNLEISPDIEFKNVSFKYEGSDKYILKDINFMIKGGQKVAFVGKNGAGKTTLVKLLARIYDPTEGAILINGVDLKDIDPSEWSSYLAILMQDYVSYNFTIEESIAMGRPENGVNIDSVIESALLTDSEEFINEFDDGYKQQLGRDFEGGVELSKGQNQKLALSRVIYRDGLVAILDEPTAAIDANSESHIFDQMTKASRDKTLIVITHRFNTTQNLDNIIVLEGGGVVEEGNHHDLLKIKGVYACMFEAQAKTFNMENIEEVKGGLVA